MSHTEIERKCARAESEFHAKNIRNEPENNLMIESQVSCLNTLSLTQRTILIHSLSKGKLFGKFVYSISPTHRTQIQWPKRNRKRIGKYDEKLLNFSFYFISVYERMNYFYFELKNGGILSDSNSITSNERKNEGKKKQKMLLRSK